MNKILTAALCGLFAVLPVVRAEEGTKAAEEKSGKVDARRLKGTYTVVKGERDGKALPADHFKGSVVTFTESKIFGTDKAKKEFFSANYTVDTNSTPATIRMMSTAPRKDKADGVIETDGDTIRICYALPGGETPRTFKTAVKQHCFTLKRVKSGS